MKQVSINVYYFNELSEQAQNKALQRAVFNAVQDFYQFDMDDLQYKLDSLRDQNFYFILDNQDVNYSGFYSQGDGLSFTGYVDNIKLIAALHKELDQDEINLLTKYSGYYKFSLIRSISRYSHEKTVYVDVDYYENDINGDDFDWFIGLIEWVQGRIEDQRIELCLELYEFLKDTYEGYTEESVLKENIKDDLFYENGEVYQYN